jgi:hypothetical protein
MLRMFEPGAAESMSTLLHRPADIWEAIALHYMLSVSKGQSSNLTTLQNFTLCLDFQIFYSGTFTS